MFGEADDLLGPNHLFDVAVIPSVEVQNNASVLKLFILSFDSNCTARVNAVAVGAVPGST